MIRIQHILLFAFFCLLLVSCEKYLEFDQEIKDSKIVVNAMFDGDSTYSVHLSNSLSVIDNADLTTIENGIVEVFDLNGNLIESLIHVGMGYYKGTLYPQTNEKYQVVSSAPGYKTVSAIDTMPPKSLIKNVDTAGVENEFNEKELRITLTFEDTPNVRNFYKLQIFGMDNVSGSIYGYPLAIRSDDVALGLSQDGYSNEILFDDVLFNGGDKTIVIYVEDTRDYDDFLEIRLTSLSESAFLYRETVKAYRESNGNPFAQPVQVFNNILDGFGILGSQHTVIKEVSF